MASERRPSSAYSLDASDLVSLRMAHTELHARAQGDQAEHARQMQDVVRRLTLAERDRDEARARSSNLALELERVEEKAKISMEAVNGVRGELSRWKTAHAAARKHTEHLERTCQQTKLELTQLITDVVPRLKEEGNQWKERSMVEEREGINKSNDLTILRAELVQTRKAHALAVEEGKEVTARLERVSVELAKRESEMSVMNALAVAERNKWDGEMGQLREKVEEWRQSFYESKRDGEARGVLEERLKEKEKEADNVERRLKETKKEMGDVKKSERKWKEEAERGRVDMERMRSEDEEKRKEIERRDEDIAVGAKKLLATEEERRQLDNDNKVAMQQVHSLQVAQSADQVRLSSLSSSLTRAESQMAAVTAELHATQATYSSSVSAITSELDETKRRLSASLKQNTCQDEQIVQLNIKMSNMRDLVYELLTQMPSPTATKGTHKKTGNKKSQPTLASRPAQLSWRKSSRRPRYINVEKGSNVDSSKKTELSGNASMVQLEKKARIAQAINDLQFNFKLD